MEADKRLEEFSLLGGPLHWLGCRLRLVRGEANTILLGLALGGSAWIILVALAFIEGIGVQMFSLSLIAGHVRLLVLIPLLFVAETWLTPRTTMFISTIVRSGIVPKNALPAMRDEIARIGRLKDSRLAEALCLLAAVLLPLLSTRLLLPGATSFLDPSRAAAGTLAAHWYYLVCLTLVRFLLFRWIWRLALWWHFLWRLARMELKLVPTHPDGAGGLGYLEVVHAGFLPLVVAISALQSASLAEVISTHMIPFEAIYPVLILIPVLDVTLFIGPLFIFAPKLWVCRAKGLSDYMTLAARYVRGFDKKWLGADSASGEPEPLLGTPDLQSLADLSSSVDVIRNMQWSPASLRLLKEIVIAALLPLLPLLQLKYPVAELAQRFFLRLSGL